MSTPKPPKCPACGTREHVVPVAGGLDADWKPLGDKWACCGCGREWLMSGPPPDVN